MTPTKKPKDRFRPINHMCLGGFAERGVPPAERHLYHVLWRNADADGNSRVSFSKLARESGYTSRHCQELVKALIERGLVRLKKAGSRGGIPNWYKIALGKKKAAP